jgi:hypothetical protein
VARINVLEDGRFQCGTCEQVYADRPGIHRHIIKHTIGAVLCPFSTECQSKRAFNRWDHLMNHVASRHPGVDAADPTLFRVHSEYLHRGARENAMESKNPSRKRDLSSGSTRPGYQSDTSRADDSSSAGQFVESTAGVSSQRSINSSKKQKTRQIDSPIQKANINR